MGIVGLALLCAGLTFALSRWVEKPPLATGLAAVPATSEAVVWVDVPALVDSPIWRALFSGRENRTRRVVERCQFDPLAQVEDLTVFAQERDGETFGQMGFLVSGPIADGYERRARLLRCLRAVLGRRSGAVREESLAGRRALVSSSGRSYGVFVDPDGIVGGDRESVLAALGVLDHAHSSAAGDTQLRGVWERVSAHRDAVAVLRIPERWRPILGRLARRMESSLGAVADVETIAVAFRVQRALDMVAVLWMPDEASAALLEQRLLAWRNALSQQLLLRLSVLGELLQWFEVASEDVQVHVRLRVPDARVARVAMALRALWSNASEAWSTPDSAASDVIDTPTRMEPNSSE